LIDFSGNSLWKKDVVAVVPANSSLSHIQIPKEDFEGFDLKKAVLSVSFHSVNKSVQSLFYFAKPKDLELTIPNITIKRFDTLTIEVNSDVLAKNVFLSSVQDTFFSDNYFDILPNQKIKIYLSKPVQTIVAKSLFDTIK
jgi:beta-mannosidase